MVATTWLGGSGAWDDAANWSNGVPGPDDDAVIPGLSDSDTITGGGAAAELTVEANRGESLDLTLSGSYSVSQYVQLDGEMELAPSATLAFDAATISGANLVIDSGAALSGGTMAVSDSLYLSGAISNPLLLSGSVSVSGSGALSGQISGSGQLQIGSYYGGGTNLIQLTSPSNNFTGGVVLNSGTLELGTTGAAGSGTVAIQTGLGSAALLLDPGVSLSSPIATSDAFATISAASASLEAFGGSARLTFIKGSGASTVIGALAPGFPAYVRDGVAQFGTLDVQGGSGNVTVFGGNESGAIYGGSAGNNVIVAGASLVGLTPADRFDVTYTTSSGVLTDRPVAVTIVGGGNGDLLVVTGSLNNLVAAASGNETLSAAGATGNNVLFGGSGSDLIAAGAGHDTVVAGTGASIIFGGAAGTAIFAGSGNAEIVDGGGGDYVQMGSGNATVFTGSGPDLFGVYNGQAGGDDLLAGFKNGTDHMLLRGYASAPTIASQGGSTTIALADNTHITLLGVASLAPNTFV
ncbi:MAG: hypothetical protein JO209_09240 [Acidisphaera sp.]|nr:hypothetical protein [Acidisphaera sp.]